MTPKNPHPLLDVIPSDHPQLLDGISGVSGPIPPKQAPMAGTLTNFWPAICVASWKVRRRMMKRAQTRGLAGRLLFATVLTLGLGVLPAAAQMFPENDYAAFSRKITKSPKDTSAIRSWFQKNLKPLDATNHMFTPEYLRFLEDVGLFNWDGSVTEQQLRRKWGKRFDVDRMIPDHPFETGNCGWESQKLAKFDYLGELNGGDWFRLTIKGGCGDNDYSQTLTRVIKVISSNGKYQIANMIAL